MKKDVYLLSGFLGSGKTTLLKNLITALKDQNLKPAVLMNELGSVSIDSQEVEEGTPLKELLDGCICCSIQDKLESQLQELLFQDEFDVLVIETTGAAHPVEVVDAVMSPLFADRLQFKGIITVVDAKQWVSRGAYSPQVLQLMREQIRHSHLLIFNKEDLISEMEKGSALFEIQQINPAAKLIITNYSRVSAAELLSVKGNAVFQDRERSAIGHQLNLRAYVHRFAGSVSRTGFEEWLKRLPDTIYRMKGYVPFSGRRYPYMFQYSYGMPLFIPEDMNLPKTLVIIGENLDEDKMAKELEDLEKTETHD
ncbi:GTP-binding protein [Bacillus salacetis]|uniref:GTP-binding protein n=1 Tax=Bacillus salacetis TaxID=2315464 RepID=A0A3A1R0L3_9BACI|nr:GTP-binding protein [Bacillus salacetis]RIW35139.1 GTP-binding protein [Bacillus salacetis]